MASSVDTAFTQVMRYIQREPIVAAAKRVSPVMAQMRMVDDWPSSGRDRSVRTFKTKTGFGRALLQGTKTSFARGARPINSLANSTETTLTSAPAWEEYTITEKVFGWSREVNLRNLIGVNRKNAFIDFLMEMNDECLRDITNVYIHQLVDDGVGHIAEVHAVTGTTGTGTITFRSGMCRSSEARFYPEKHGSMFIENDAKYVGVNSSNVGKVTFTVDYIDKATDVATITVTSGDVSDLAAGSFIIRGTLHSNALNYSLNEGWVGMEAALTADNTYHNVDRSTAPILNPQLRYVNGVSVSDATDLQAAELQPLDEDSLIEAWNAIPEASFGEKESNFIFGTPHVSAEIRRLYGGMVRYEPKIQANFKYLEVNGMNIIEDIHFKPQRLYFSRLGDWEVISEKSFFEGNPDGLPDVDPKYVQSSASATDAYAAHGVYVYKKNEVSALFNGLPQWCGAMRALETNIAVVPAHG